VYYNAGVETLYTVKDGLADDVILALAGGQNGAVWAGTRNGFSRLRNGTIDSYGYRDGLSQNTVFGVYEDHEGALWVATKNGLNQFLDGAAARYDHSQGLPKDNMGPVFQDRRGTLWAGSLDGILSRFNGRSFTALPNFPRVRINVLADDSAGDLWAGTSQGAIHLQDGQVKEIYTTAQGLPANQIHALFRDHAGNLWAGTEKGPAVFQSGRFIQLPFLAKELPYPIVAIGETHDGGMLFAAGRGNVYVFAEGGVRKLESAPGELPLFQDINAIYGWVRTALGWGCCATANSRTFWCGKACTTAKSTALSRTRKTACGWPAAKASFGWTARNCSNLPTGAFLKSRARLIARWTACGPSRERRAWSRWACGPTMAGCGFRPPDGCWLLLRIKASGRVRFLRW
jgi:hypothetical protein